MDKENIELNRETLPPLQDSEGREIKPAEAEFYKQAEERKQRTWSTQSEKEAMPDEVQGKILQFRPKEAKPAEATETGLSAVEHEKLLSNPTEWVNEAIGNAELSAYEKMSGLTEATEEIDKAA